jgi:hypothetical protein
MKQTDNEWDDALDDVNSNNIPDEEKEPKRDVPVFQKRVHPKSSRPGTPSSIPESSPAEPAMESPIPVVSKQKNANGLKDNITELIKGKRARTFQTTVTDWSHSLMHNIANTRSIKFFAIVHTRCR